MSLRESYFPALGDEPLLELTVGDVLGAGARAWPQAIALVEADMAGTIGRQWSFSELLADSERLAGALASRFAPGERIAVWAPNIPEWVVLEYAAALAGLTLVTANPAYQARELKFVLEQSRAAGLFLTPDYRGNPMAEIAADAAAGLRGLREVVDMTNGEALFAVGTNARPLPNVRPTDPAQIQYTSGTTGFPKGAVLSHRGLTNNARLTFARARASHGATVLNFMPMFHTAGCACLTLGSMQFGCRMIIAKLFEPHMMLDIIDTEGGDFLLGVPTMLVGLLEAQAARPRRLDSLRMVVSGGSMVPPDLVRRVRAAFGCDFELRRLRP